MNKMLPDIQNYDELMAERTRLESLIDNQKNIIRHDLDELKAEFKKEIRPAIEAANVVKKFARPETRVNALVTTGSGLLIDLIFKKIFKNSLVMQVLVPKILKNYTTHVIQRLKNNSVPPRPVKKHQQTL